tara:strand:- start:295 stop:582 length:288 start_codon:yes stop_codon:yes gene_type:complete
LIAKEDFTILDLNKFEHAKKYCQLLNSKPEDLMMCKESNSYNNLINKSIKMVTLNLKHNGDFFNVVFRNISGSAFAFYPEKKIIIIGQSSLYRLL